VRITEAAERLGLTPRMLRYRESLGLLPVVRQARRRQAGRPPAAAGGTAARAGAAAGAGAAARTGAAARAAGRAGRADTRAGARIAAGEAGRGRARGEASTFSPHRQFTEADLAAVSLGLAIERRYDVSPAALAFGIRVLADSRVRADVAELGRRIGRIQPPPARVLDFEKERAQRLLRLADRER